jgi:hypothetical protein
VEGYGSNCCKGVECVSVSSVAGVVVLFCLICAIEPVVPFCVEMCGHGLMKDDDLLCMSEFWED